MGLCECGCGRPAPLARFTNRRIGWVKGQPIRFIQGHQLKGAGAANWRGGVSHRADGYRSVYQPDHPNANNGGHVLEHVVVATKILGRPLPKEAVIHHVNGDPRDNRPSNLVVCENRAYHMLLHKRMRALDACGNANWVKCGLCHRYGDPANMHVQRKPGRSARHRECDAQRAREHRARLFARGLDSRGKPRV